jgi:hypothetical protein
MSALLSENPLIAIDGRFAWVVNTVVPAMFTSQIRAAPVGAVVTAVVIERMVPANGIRTAALLDVVNTPVTDRTIDSGADADIYYSLLKLVDSQ